MEMNGYSGDDPSSESQFEEIDVTGVDLNAQTDSEIIAAAIKTETAMEQEMLFTELNQMPQISAAMQEFNLMEEIHRGDYMINAAAAAAMINDAYPSTSNHQIIANCLTDPMLMSSSSKLPLEILNLMKSQSGVDVKVMTDSHNYKYVNRDGKYIKVWSCNICHKEFGHQYTLVRHLPTHTDERKFICNICGKAFRQMSTLSQHRAIHSAERPYVCEICHKTFNRVSTLISHRKTHTGLKPHCCHLCNKAFHQKGNLRNHIFTHTNERPYKCDVCNKGFNQMSNLMCHKMKAHHRTDKPKYNCQICGKEFQKRAGLRNHEQYQHGMQQPSYSTQSTENRMKYTNGVLVDPINTAAMQIAMATNQTPFALLRPLNGIPVLVRVLQLGDKQMLIPATAEDLKTHGQITYIQSNDGQSNEENNPNGKYKNGLTVQIKIPVVATVTQRRNNDGNMCMAIQSPGPDSDNMDMFASNSCGGQGISAQVNPLLLENMGNVENNVLSTGTGNNAIRTEFEYFDETGNFITEEEFQNKTRMMELPQYQLGLGQSMPTFSIQENASSTMVNEINVTEMHPEPSLNEEEIIPLKEIDTNVIVVDDSNSDTASVEISKIAE